MFVVLSCYGFLNIPMIKWCWWWIVIPQPPTHSRSFMLYYFCLKALFDGNHHNTNLYVFLYQWHKCTGGDYSQRALVVRRNLSIFYLARHVALSFQWGFSVGVLGGLLDFICCHCFWLLLKYPLLLLKCVLIEYKCICCTNKWAVEVGLSGFYHPKKLLYHLPSPPPPLSCSQFEH